MFDSVTVDIVIGICFLYVFLSLICSIVTEWISRALGMRSKMREKESGPSSAAPRWRTEHTSTPWSGHTSRRHRGER